MPARDVHHWIDRWERAGLLGDDLAQRLRDDATRAGTAPGVEADAVDRVLAAARSGVVEALGYVGAALTVGAAVVLLDVPAWPRPALAGALLVAAAVAGTGTFLLAPARTAATGRLAGVLGAVAVATTAAGAVQALAPGSGQALSDAPGRELAVALPALAVGALVYVRHRHLLTHAAMGAATVASGIGLGDLVAGRSASADARQAVVGVVLLVLALAWVVAGEAGRLEPAWLGTPVAGAVAFVGIAMATSWSVWSGAADAAVLAALVLAVAFTAAGIAAARLRVTIVGTAGLLVTVPMTFVEVLGWSGTATAGLLLPIGVGVTLWAVLAGRRQTAGS